MWSSRQVLVGAVPALLALALGACSSSTSVNASLSNPAATTAQAAAMDSAFASPQVESFAGLAALMPQGGTLVAPTLRLLQAAPLPQAGTSAYAALASAARAFQQVVPSFSSFAATGIFPDSVKGWVLTWDVTTHTYAHTASNGPATGVRFVLYAVDANGAVIESPLTQVGFADLLDETPTGGSATLGIQVKNTDSTVTYLDYTFTGSGSTSSFTATVTGTVTNGLSGGANKTLTFSVGISGSGSSVTLTSSFQLNNPAVSAQETATISDDGTTTTLTIAFSLTASGETVSLGGNLSFSDTTGDGTVNLTFKVNGATLATVTGAISSPTIARAGGGQLSSAEFTALAQVFETAGNVGDQVEKAFDPAEQVLGL